MKVALFFVLVLIVGLAGVSVFQQAVGPDKFMVWGPIIAGVLSVVALVLVLRGWVREPRKVVR